VGIIIKPIHIQANAYIRAKTMLKNVVKGKKSGKGKGVCD
jgi:hypothetical protein